MNESATEPPDHVLLQQMRDRERLPAIAEQAFDKFYNRHRGYVYDQVCFAKRKLRMKKIDEEDFVIEVFRKVWQSACQTYSRSKSNEEIEERLSVRAWLGTIAKNLILDELGVRANVLSHDNGVERTSNGETSESIDAEDSTDLIHRVNSVLSERDAKVVWFKIQAYDPATGECQPDPTAVDVFCTENGIKPEYLRKIYSRAIVTLREAMALSVPFIHRQ